LVADNPVMPRILVCEPYPEIRELLAHIVGGLGFEPVLYRDGDAVPPDVGVLLLEPALSGGVELAREIRARNPACPIICVSIYPPTPETSALAPFAYLMKPFALAELQRTLQEAVALAAIPA